jgi:hypothetical protein
VSFSTATPDSVKLLRPGIGMLRACDFFNTPFAF